MTARELHELLVCDALCDRYASAVGPWWARQGVLGADPFLNWVAELGLREGEWLRKKEAAA
jgi:hypothetical protein